MARDPKPASPFQQLLGSRKQWFAESNCLNPLVLGTCQEGVRCILESSMEKSLKGMDDPQAFAESTRRGFKLKADHNKQESLFCFVIVIACSLASPLFITLGHGLWLGKILPSVLSLVAAGSTAWLQLRKPQSLWIIYRDCQRSIEDSQTKFVYGLEEYAVSEDERRMLLANDVRKIALDAHRRWLPLVPTPEAIGGFNSKGIVGDGSK